MCRHQYAHRDKIYNTLNNPNECSTEKSHVLWYTFLDVSVSPFSGSFPVTRSAWATESPAGQPMLENANSQPPEFNTCIL